MGKKITHLISEAFLSVREKEKENIVSYNKGSLNINEKIRRKKNLDGTISETVSRGNMKNTI